MSQKLTTQALTEMLAKEAGINKRAADTFVKAFIQTVIEGGIKDGNVKIKGLGTFKVTQVADRESADVNTGKRIVIAGYKKMSFSTDINMDEAYESVDDTDIKENKKEEANADKPKSKTKATKTTKEKKEPAKTSENQDNNSVISENEKEIQNEITEQIPVAPVVTFSTKEEVTSAEPELPKTEVVNDSPIQNLISRPKENEDVDKAISDNNDNTDDTATEETNEELTQVEETPVTEPVAEVIPSKPQPTEIENKSTEVETESAKVETESAMVETETESTKTEIQPTKVEIESTKATDSSEPTSPTSTATSSIQSTKKIWIWGAVAVACVIICAIIILATGNSSSKNKDIQATTEVSQNETPKDTVVTNENKPEDDKVSKPKVHILQKGESLTTISVMYYHTKDSMGAIWKLNKFKNPNDIPLGTEIKLP